MNTEFKGVDEIVDGLLEKQDGVIVGAMTDIVAHILETVRRIAPRKTGRLAAFLRSRRWGKSHNWHIVEDAATPWGRYVREGTRPHLIFPRVRKALWWPGLPHPVAYVRHPGTRPNPYHVDGARRAMPGVDLRLARLAGDIAATITRKARL